MAKGGQKVVHETMKSFVGPGFSIRSTGRVSGMCGCGGVTVRALVAGIGRRRMKDVCAGRAELKDSEGKTVSAATTGCGGIYPRAGKGNRFGSA